MTVSTEACYAERNWTGVETSFTPGFPANSTGEVKVYSRDPATGIATLLTAGVHYNVTIGAVDKAVTVIPVALPAAPKTILILRDTLALQPTNFANLAKFQPRVHTDLHDAAAMRDAEDKFHRDRALLAPLGETLNDIPRAADRAGKVLGFDGSGQPIATTATGGPGGPTDLTGAVRYDIVQGLTGGQQSQARSNIDAAATSHTHTKAQITDFAHTHLIADITGLQAALDGKAALSHTHTKAQITDFAHTHLIADVSGLQAALDGKQPLDGDLTAIAAFSGASAGVLQRTGTDTWTLLTDTQLTTHIDLFTSSLKGAVPVSPGGTTAFLRADGSWATPSGTGSGLSDAYAAMTDGANTATALANDIFKLRSANSKLSIVVTNNDATHGDNALFTVNAGDVVGPASATDNAIARFDGATGKLIQNSGATIDDSGNIAAPNLREKLAANRTYYVRTDGSDGNNGLANTAGGAFLTIQKAIDVVKTIDIGGFAVTIQVGAGTYSGGASIAQAFTGGTVTLQGDTTTPSNVVISTSGTCISVSGGAVLAVGGFKLASSGGGGIFATGASTVSISGKMEYGAISGTALFAANYSLIQHSSMAFTISANQGRFIWAATGTVGIGNCAVTITGTPAWATEFVLAEGGGYVYAVGATFSGSATGKRFSVSGNSTVNTGNAGLNNFPGNAAGTVIQGGVYDNVVDPREKLTADRTYFVNPSTGNNSNDGLTSGTAFATIQKAVDVVAETLDLGGKGITIQLADGTYTATTSLKNVVGFAGAGSLIVQGNAATPANVIVSVTGANCFAADGSFVTWYLKDMELRTTTGGNCISAANGASIGYGNIRFGACAAWHVIALSRSNVFCIGNYAIVGAPGIYHMTIDSLSKGDIGQRTVTITGNPNLTRFASISNNGFLEASNFSFTGTATGVRYAVQSNALIQSNGGNKTTYFPGDTAGIEATGGIWV